MRWLVDSSCRHRTQSVIEKIRGCVVCCVQSTHTESIGCSFKKSASIFSCSPYNSSLSMTSRPWRISACPFSSTLTGAGGRRGTEAVFAPSFLPLPAAPLDAWWLLLLLGASVVSDRLRLELMGTRFVAEAAFAAERRRDACDADAPGRDSIVLVGFFLLSSIVFLHFDFSAYSTLIRTHGAFKGVLAVCHNGTKGRWCGRVASSHGSNGASDAT